MSRERVYPDDPAGPFPRPPTTFADAEGREIAVRVYGNGPLDGAAETDALVEMYDDFDPADRAQGIPPTTEPAVRDWLARLLVAEAVNVLAWNGARVVGHATLVPDDRTAYELAIFVLQSHQAAGIGSRLVRHLLGEGAARGATRVWLTVERWNRAAIGLYRSVGFEPTRSERFELEMTLRLG